jgi:DNA polymerase-3 subunit delta'
MIAGHQSIIQYLQRLASSDALSQGYMFYGESELGKATVARAFAHFLEQGDFSDAPQILQETLYISTAPDKAHIGIDEARDIKHFLSQNPQQGNYRIVIIDNAHFLTAQAQNALLKIIEEPPVHSLFLVIARHPDSILDTLQSRLQHIHFGAVPNKEIEELLVQDFGVSEGEAKKVSLRAHGKPGRAVSLLQNEGYKALGAQASRFVAEYRNRSVILKELDAEKENIIPFIEHVIADISDDPIKNFSLLQTAFERLSVIHDFNTSKRLQMEPLVWNSGEKAKKHV